MRESVIEVHLVKCITRLGGLALKLVIINLIGFPDRLVLLSAGRILFVELKAPGQVPRSAQLRWHERLRKLGFRVEVIDSLQQVNWLAEEYGQ